MKLPLDGSPPARSMTLCDPPQRVTELGALSLGVDRCEGQPHRQGRVADRLDEVHGFGCQLRRLAHPGLERVIGHQPCRGDGQRRLVPGRGAQLPQFIKAVPGDVPLYSPGGPAQHGARGDAHGCPVRVIGG
jgi:hypothetical protein